MEELIPVRDPDFEYFCNGCGQLRLFVVGEKKRSFNGCGNCGSLDVVKGQPGELDKIELKASWRRTQA